MQLVSKIIGRARLVARPSCSRRERKTMIAATIAGRLPAPVEALLKELINARRRRSIARQRRSLAMEYYSSKLELLDRWVWQDTETSNFYYKIAPDNRDHLAHLISVVSAEPYSKVTEYFDELEGDESLRRHLSNLLKTTEGRDIQIDYSRRLGWYAFARVLKPKILVETGVDHGVGSCVLASALLRNASEGFPGRYFGTEIRSGAGKLFSAQYATTGKILYDDSIRSLKALDEKIDLFINDSDHSAEYEYHEYLTIAHKLSQRSIILGDNAHATDSLSRFSRENNRSFVFFSEKPENHWYPGAGIGISFTR
jgi:predicted O-methyltransferase YrrM